MEEKKTQETKKTWISPEVAFDEVKNVEGGNLVNDSENTFNHIS
jgi:hypothetical protein